jgi:ribonucleoside-triphosphate reductase
MDNEHDRRMLDHPESMRYCGFQNVTINLPQAAYRAGKGNVDDAIKDILESMDICVKAHLEKKAFVTKMMARKGLPLWQIGKISPDGYPYVDLEKASYIMGMIGLNECVQALSGEQLHESDAAFKLGLKIISSMFIKVNALSKEHGLKFVLEESPAESAARRMAKVDLKEYPESRKYIKGDIENDTFYYTNSIHFAPGIDMSIVERITKQSKFHSLIAAGAIIHAFIGEEKPSPESIMNLVKKTWENTNAAQITISPEFTICNSCHSMARGVLKKCGTCGSENVPGISWIEEVKC